MAKKREYAIYKHTAPNGKVYIGITSLEPSLRYGKDGCNYSGCPLFYRAIQKYGWNEIKHRTIKTGLSKAEAMKKEVQLILKYKSAERRYGYNISHGGAPYGGGHSDETKRKISESMKGEKNPFYGKKHPPEIMERIRQANIGKKMSEEFKAGCRERYKGEGNPNYGKHPSDKTREIWSKQRKGRTLSDEWKQKISETSAKAKSVTCIETGEVFRSCREAAKVKSINTPRSIGDVCNGKLKTCGGYHWKFTDQSLAQYTVTEE